ncbi:HAD family hydrolase [Nocardia sp. NPDC058633]|uniref:HAD family hydrolase n=1 Tax=Nocardia sp. NPDC058633 TaxID=3346568 RepID=UPI0036584064
MESGESVMGTASATVEADRTAILVDFGGVMTSSVLRAFEEFGSSLGGDPNLPLRLLGRDEASRRLLSDHESGLIDEGAFERGFAERLRAHGATVDAEGLVARMQAGLVPDTDTMALISEVRAAGYPVALVSNAFGRDCYAGFDLDAMADRVVISSEVGIRKPSRRIYSLACEQLGVPPTRAVMIDDLRQNLDGAARLGIAGLLHTDAGDTRRQLAERFGIRVRRTAA